MIIHQKRTIEETDQVRIPWKQVHSALAKTSQKVHKSAQNTPGNHPTTTTPSTTYESFPTKTPHPPPFHGFASFCCVQRCFRGTASEVASAAVGTAAGPITRTASYLKGAVTTQTSHGRGDQLRSGPVGGAER